MAESLGNMARWETPRELGPLRPLSTRRENRGATATMLGSYVKGNAVRVASSA